MCTFAKITLILFKLMYIHTFTNTGIVSIRDMYEWIFYSEKREWSRSQFGLEYFCIFFIESENEAHYGKFMVIGFFVGLKIKRNF